MALEEYYKLLLREAAEDRVAQAKAEALAKRRKAEESAATRRRRREAARSRRTEAEELHAQQEAALVKAKADKQVEAKVAAALEEADQARKKAEMEAEAATWAAQRLKRRVKKRMQKGGWRLNASGFEQLGADGGPRDAATRTGGAENGGGDGVSEELMFFDSVATEVL
jgi:membrane protein involved in colicin uptake